VDPELTNSCIKNSGVAKTTVSTVSNSKNDAYWAADGSGSTNNTSTTLEVNTLILDTKKESGILFDNLQIPQNAVASTATLRVYASKTVFTGVQAVTIKGFSSPDVSFCPAGTCSNPTTLKNLPLTTNSTSWSPGLVTTDQFYDIDVTNIVNDVLTNTGWNVGKNIGFKLWSSTPALINTAIYSFDGPATYRPKLTINWSVNELNQLTFLETVRDQIEQEVNNLTLKNYTPLASTFAAASRYMYGMQPYYKSSTDYDPRVVEKGGTSAVRYISPIPEDDQCSANYIFLLTDGEPNAQADVTNDVKDIMGSTKSVCSDNWSCMNKLAQYNNKTTKLNNTTPKKKIYTSTMILGPLETAEDNMKTVSETYGGGKAYTATDTAALAKAFTDVVNDAVKSSGTISAAGVAVNQLNRLNHLDQLYYAVFDPKPNSLHWQGNLKRYRLGTDGVIYDNSTPAKNAVNSDTGFFKSDAKSFWSTAVDGESASAGGAASKLTATKLPTRKMYTYTDALTSLSSPVSLQEIDFTNLGSTTTLNTTLQGKTGTSGTEYINLMKWYQGYDISSLTSTNTPTEARQRLGGALHSRPILVNYGYTGELATANNADNQDNYLFFSTLEGSLHVVNAKTGEEKFTFTPGEKLATLKDLYLNPAAVLPAFGMDLTWVSYRKDTDGSGQIGTGDKIWLYGGMRMGGDNYYALDVTNLDSPKLMFAIDGGKTGTKYARMGQTWSEPVITSIYVEGKPKRVMIFGGGYDDKHENHALALPFADIDKGNQIYIVDAEKGDLLWMASGNSTDSPDKLVDDMKFSIPSSPKALDLDSDGVADVIYIGDLGGQVFRIDLDRKATTKTNIAKRVRLIAKVGQTETANLVNQRRFYEPPAVATFKNTSGSLFAAVSMGSGYRSRPLNTVTDERFYTFFDYDVTKPNLLSLEDSALQAVITHADLDLLDMNAAATQQNGVGQTKKGWYVDFPESGEKALASGFIFKEKLVFSSYSPTASSTTNCTPVKGKTNLYTMCMPYGKMCWAAGSEPTGFNNYKKSNIMAGLGGEPQLILTKNPSTGANELNVLVGTSVDKGIFAGITAGSAQLVPTKKWREKTKK
ncbi:PilC/PilY family type IV pilus protein, partial [uncultured Agitococcus sp.]|uniref:pilus assembly protein n=1 Tax=uncultured Agitococcus sp. TaxID=1506599 RepID=UPI002607B645